MPEDCALIVQVTKRYSRKTMMRFIDWDFRYIPELHKTCIICNLNNDVYPSEAEKPPLPELDANLDPVWPEGAVNSAELPPDIPVAFEDEDIVVEYISDSGETSSYTAAFVRCLSAQLAADICMPITHDMQKFQFMLQLAEKYRTDALRQNMNEEGPDKVHWIDPLTRSRGW